MNLYGQVKYYLDWLFDLFSKFFKDYKSPKIVMSLNLLIIGGSDAGISAALRAKELEPNTKVTIILADAYPNFSICGIPFYISKEVSHWKNLAHRTAQDIEALGIELRMNEYVEAIDPNQKTVTSKDINGNIQQYSYDKLVIGTGARSITPPISGMDLDGVFTLRWIGEMKTIDQYIENQSVKNAVVVGGGYIGLEMADALILRGVHVQLVEYAPAILTTVDEELGKVVQQKLEEKGIQINTQTLIQNIERNSEGLTVKGANGFETKADFVLVAVGAVPESGLAKNIGIETGIKGAIKVNEYMETNVPDIYAAGDCVETWHQLAEQFTYLPLGTTAHKQGRIAGENALGGQKAFKGSLGTQSIKLFDTVIARTGLNDKDAKSFGINSFTLDKTFYDHKVYYPHAKDIRIRLTGEIGTNQLLGIQMLGTAGTEVSKRVDIVAAAIFNGLTIDDLNDLDLSYTPPLSSPWDPVQMAAQEWIKSTKPQN